MKYSIGDKFMKYRQLQYKKRLKAMWMLLLGIPGNLPIA